MSKMGSLSSQSDTQTQFSSWIIAWMDGWMDGWTDGQDNVTVTPLLILKIKSTTFFFQIYSRA